MGLGVWAWAVGRRVDGAWGPARRGRSPSVWRVRSPPQVLSRVLALAGAQARPATAGASVSALLATRWLVALPCRASCPAACAGATGSLVGPVRWLCPCRHTSERSVPSPCRHPTAQPPAAGARYSCSWAASTRALRVRATRATSDVAGATARRRRRRATGAVRGPVRRWGGAEQAGHVAGCRRSRGRRYAVLVRWQERGGEVLCSPRKGGQELRSRGDEYRPRGTEPCGRTCVIAGPRGAVQHVGLTRIAGCGADALPCQVYHSSRTGTRGPGGGVATLQGACGGDVPVRRRSTLLANACRQAPAAASCPRATNAIITVSAQAARLTPPRCPHRRRRPQTPRQSAHPGPTPALTRRAAPHHRTLHAWPPTAPAPHRSPHRRACQRQRRPRPRLPTAALAGWRGTRAAARRWRRGRWACRRAAWAEAAPAGRNGQASRAGLQGTHAWPLSYSGLCRVALCSGVLCCSCCAP
jgi:hypothetical protein